MGNIILGGLVLDLSTRTDRQKISDLINIFLAPFEHTRCIDLIEHNTQLENRLVLPSDILSGFSFYGSLDEFGKIDVQAKNAHVISSVVGEFPNYHKVERFFRSNSSLTYDPRPSVMFSQMVLRVNIKRHITCPDTEDGPYPFENYTHRVKCRVSDTLEGAWAAQCLFLSRSRSTIVLARRGDECMYLTLVAVDGATVLIWSSQMNAIDSIMGASPELEEMRKEIWISCLSVLQEKTTAVIHPVYLLSKVRYFGQGCKYDPIRIGAKLEKYLAGGVY